MSRRQTPRHVLITQNALFDFAGSETVTFELAEHFSQSGDEVTVVTHGWSLAWLARFESLAGVSVKAFADPKLDNALRQDPPDLAWIHHQLIPDSLLRAPGDTTFVFHHMSVAHPSEFAISHRIERALASAVLFPAPETLDFHAEFGLLSDIDPTRLQVVGNPAPDTFGQHREKRSSGLSRLLVVSNHIPAELDAALDLLSDMELRVRGKGDRPGTLSAPITPSDLQWADAVVTIGKTVQYALVGAVPVYCYDYFGGPGWLSAENVTRAAYSNFSGRGFESKSAATIVHELRSGFLQADLWAEEHADSLSNQYLIGHRLTALLDGIEPIRPARLDDADVIAHGTMLKAQGILINVGAGAEVRVIQATEKIFALEAEIERCKRDLEAKTAQIDDVLGSRSFRAFQRLAALRHGRLSI